MQPTRLRILEILKEQGDLTVAELARQLGCYQLRSYSSGDKEANHRLKIAMGFAMHRTVRGNDQQGAYFVMPLQCAL